jgi:hypothetical protein
VCSAVPQCQQTDGGLAVDLLECEPNAVVVEAGTDAGPTGSDGDAMGSSTPRGSRSGDDAGALNEDATVEDSSAAASGNQASGGKSDGGGCSASGSSPGAFMGSFFSGFLAVAMLWRMRRRADGPQRSAAPGRDLRA